MLLMAESCVIDLKLKIPEAKGMCSIWTSYSMTRNSLISFYFSFTLLTLPFSSSFTFKLYGASKSCSRGVLIQDFSFSSHSVISMSKFSIFLTLSFEVPSYLEAISGMYELRRLTEACT